MLKYAAIIGCQFKNISHCTGACCLCEPEVIGNSLLTASQGAPCTSFHTWTLQYLQQFSEFRDVQGTLAGPAKQNVNKENRAGA